MVALDGLADTVTVAPAAARRVTLPGHRRARQPGMARPRRAGGRGRPAASVRGRDRQAHPRPGGARRRLERRGRRAGRRRPGSTASISGRERLERVAARVGSDVPFFVRGGAQWAEGRGELLRPASVAPFAAVLAKPGAGLSTAAVYRAFDRLPPPPAVVAAHASTCRTRRSLLDHATTYGARRLPSRRGSGRRPGRSRRPAPTRCCCAAAARAWRASSRRGPTPRRRPRAWTCPGSAPWSRAPPAPPSRGGRGGTPARPR